MSADPEPSAPVAPGTALAPAGDAPPSRRLTDPALPDVPFVQLIGGADGQTLCHLLTGEQLLLQCHRLGIQEVQGGRSNLTFAEGQGVLWYNGKEVGSVKLLWAISIYLADGVAYAAARDGQLAWLPRHVVCTPMKYFNVPVESVGSDAVLKVYDMGLALGARFWLDMKYLHCFQSWGTVYQSQALRNNIKSIGALAKKLGLTHSALALLDGRQTFSHTLKSPSVSSTGLLLAFLCLCCGRRGEETHCD